MNRTGQITAMLIAFALGYCAPAAADSPFFQAFQDPSPTLAAPPPGSIGASAPQSVGSPLPPIAAPNYGPTLGAPAPFQTGVISSTIIDQPVMTPSPAPASSEYDWFGARQFFGIDSNLMMPWDFGPAYCDDCRTNGLVIFHSYASWRGISEGTGENNNGFSYGFNYGTKLGVLSDYTGIGLQIGASYGLYDLNGRSSGFRDKEIQQQTFLTVGIFRSANRTSNFSFGVVWDGMFNTNFGEYAVSPFLNQVRGQIAYALNQQHEIGFWTAVRLNTASASAGGQALEFRAVDQFTLFYHHRFGFGGDGITWIGITDHSKLGGTGSLGEYTYGGTLTAPLSPRFGAFTSLQYMAPSSRSGAAAAVEESFYITAGVSFFPYANSRPSNVAGDCWMPYMPVATDGTFLVDTNHTF